ncbi:poly [ADP-ribose] polymerase 2-like [Curcuma longa]|uniref:poly [ADP-ribose] polymerase 2-like n=1 Tax=Curcuma longa TaxID=136217 RepID=UPI003D9DC0AE
MFGKGVYFADMFSKSANYYYASTQSREGVLLLCEVALGDMAELLSANYNADQLPEGKLRWIYFFPSSLNYATFTSKAREKQRQKILQSKQEEGPKQKQVKKNTPTEFKVVISRL